MRNFLEHVESVWSAYPAKPALMRWSAEEGKVTETWTFSELMQRSVQAGAGLAARWQCGERALVCITEPLEFAAAFLGCWRAGLIPVPVAAPTNRVGAELLAGVARRTGSVAMLVGDQELAKLAAAEALPPRVSVKELLAHSGVSLPTARNAEGDDIAFLQFTSGSSGAPKGVAISHANLLANAANTSRAFDQNARDTFGSWLPLYHDMGLIGCLLQPLYNGAGVASMRPKDFVHRPSAWLEMITALRVSQAGGPNFAYDLLLRRYRNASLSGLDLSSWRVAFTGAEPVRAKTLKEFGERFSECGFAPSALLPCYGMAEGTLIISGHRVPGFPLVAEPAHDQTRSGQATTEYVSCGRPVHGLTVRIVHPETKTVLPELQIGEIWAMGGSIAKAYYQDPGQSEATFANLLADGSGPYLRTGDLGFMHNGELFIAGRLKDVIPYRGRSVHATDIEAIVQRAHQALSGTPCAAFEIEGADGSCGVAVVAEVRKEVEWADVSSLGLGRACEDAVLRELEVKLNGVVLLKPGELPLTTSGKVRRSFARELYYGRAPTLSSNAPSAS